MTQSSHFVKQIIILFLKKIHNEGRQSGHNHKMNISAKKNKNKGEW